MGNWKSSLEGLEVIDLSFWKNKKVFITGHTGFKGAWLTLWLHELGAKITGYGLPANTDPSFYEALNIKSICQDIVGDVRDLQFLKEALDSSQAEIVFHLAAQPLVRKSYEDPVETFSTNVMGTVHLLEAVKNSTHVKACVIVTSDKCYENQELPSAFYKEEDRLGGHDPYSSSKACSEIVTSTYIKSFFHEKSHLGVATARAGNVIGGGDFAQDRLIPDIYRAIIEKKDLRIRFPDSIRPWQHVLVSLSGYLKLAEQLFHHPKTYSGPYNFGPIDKEVLTVREMVDLMLKEISQDLVISYESQKVRHEAKLLKLDTSKATSVLGWRQVWTMKVAIEQTALWYKAFLDNQDIKRISLDQIREFEKRL